MLKRARSVKKDRKGSNSVSAKKIKRKKHKGNRKTSSGSVKQQKIENGTESVKKKLSVISDSTKHDVEITDYSEATVTEDESYEEASSDIIIKTSEEENDGSKETSKEKQISDSKKESRRSPKKKTVSSSTKKKAGSPPVKKKAESPPYKKKTESPPHKKKAESPPHKKKAESSPRKKKIESPPSKMRVESPPKRKTEIPPPNKKAESLLLKKKTVSSKKPLSPSPKKKKILDKTRSKTDPVSKKGPSSKQSKEKKKDARKKKISKKKPVGISKQDKEKKYDAEEQKSVEYEPQDQPTEEGIEQLQEPIGKEGEHDPIAAAKEKERIEKQLQEIATILENFDAMLQREKLKDWEDEQWKRYLRECGKANPLITCEANGYITTWQDLTEDEDAMSILRESHSCLETHKNLHQLLQDKLDKATYELLKGATNYLDPDTYNMRLVTSDVRAIHEISTEKIDEAEVLLLENHAPILLCLWANLVRNPRFKGPFFSQIGHSVELPRSLLVTECALRILHTSFDPYSLYRLNEKQRLKDQTSGKQKESDEENSEIGGDAATASLTPTATSLQTDSSPPTPHTTVTKPTKRKKKQAKLLKSPRLSESKPSPPETESDKRDDEDDELGGSSLMSPKLFLPQQIVDMKGNYILGGVFHIDLVAIPPLPVITANWILEQVEKNPKLQHIKYHIDVRPPRPPKPGEKPTQAAMYAEAENRRYEDELTSAISITFKLPDLVLFLDQPQLAFWDESNTLWVNEGFHELKYNEDNRSLTFKIVRLGVIGIVQSKYVNFPYQAWELKPKEYCNNCSLSITGAQVSVVIEIFGGKCCISQLQTLEDSALHAELCNEWMKARQLLKKLKNIGIYIVPDEYATFYLGNTPKEKELENNVYKCMAMFADVYLFGSSHWNATVGQKRIVMKYSPTCGKEIEGTNSLLLVEREQAIFLQCVEHSSSFRDDPLSGSERCAVFYHLLLSGATSNGLERMNKCNDAYCSCVYKLLSSIKLLSY